MDKQKVLIKQLILDITEDEYIDLVTRTNQLIQEPKANKNKMLKQIYKVKLNSLCKKYFQTDKEQSLIQILEFLLENNDLLENKLVDNEKNIKALEQQVKSLKETISEKEIKIMKTEGEKIFALNELTLKFNKEKNSLQEKLEEQVKQIKILQDQNEEQFKKMFQLEDQIALLKSDVVRVQGENCLRDQELKEVLKKMEVIRNIRKFLPSQIEAVFKIEQSSEVKSENLILSRESKLVKIFTHTKLKSFLSGHSLFNFCKLSKTWNCVCLLDPEYFWTIQQRKVQKYEHIINEMNQKLHFFENKSKSVDLSLKQFYLYKNLYKKSFNFEIDEFEKTLLDVCQKIIQQTLKTEEQEEVEEKEDAPPQTFSFFSSIKNKFSQLNENKLTENLTTFRRLEQKQEPTTEELEKNFQKYYHLFIQLSIFDQKTDFNQYLVEGFDRKEMSKHIHSLSLLLKKKQIPYNYLTDILSKVLELSFNIYSDYKENHILKLFLIEEFEKIFNENQVMQQQIVKQYEKYQMEQRIQLFNIQKISDQEKRLHSQAIHLIEKNQEIKELSDNLKMKVNDLTNLQEKYDKETQENQAIQKQFYNYQNQNDRLKQENTELNEKIFSISNIIKKVLNNQFKRRYYSPTPPII